MTANELRKIEIRNRITTLESRKGLRQVASNKNVIAKLQRKLRSLEK